MGVYSNEAAAYAASVKEAAVNPIQFAIDSYRSDLQLFEAMIERDVSYALNESGVIVLEEEQVKAVDEAAKKGIITKIKEAIEKVISWIKSAFSAFKNKVLEVVKADKTICKKYAPYLKGKYDTLKNCPAKGTALDYTMVEKIDKALDTCISSIDGFADFKGSEIDTAKETYGKVKEAISKVKESVGKMKDTTDKKLIEKISSTAFDDIIKSVETGYKSTVDGAKKRFDANMKAAQQRKDTIKVQMNYTDDKEEVKNLHNLYTITNMQIALIKQIIDIAVIESRTKLSVNRSNFIVLGSWAEKQFNGGTTTSNESAIIDENYILESTSDELVESIMSWV